MAPVSTEAARGAPTGAEVRVTAARVVQAVRARGQSLTDALGQLPPFADERDRALAQELSFGTLRLLPRLEALGTLLMHKPLRTADQDVGALVLVGLYQLAETRIPAHAAVAATVAAVRLLGKPSAASLVNALLRRYLRERTQLEAQIAERPDVQSLFPDWLQQAIAAAWPADWPAILAASNARPPMFLRVNRLKTDRDAYRAQLAAAGLGAEPLADCPAGLLLATPVSVAGLPGFAAGLVSIQDAGAQLAAELLDAQAGERVLDACAAPGGKSAHILERSGNKARLTALDKDADRLARLREGLQRLGLTAAEVIQGDAGAPHGAWAARRYDRILLDVPCSATGVIRRHPDIKWLRRTADIAQLCAQQAQILIATWPLLAPGGRLLYTTCSLLPAENDEQIGAFLAHHPDAVAEPIAARWGTPCRHGRQTLPAEQGPDGFYYARLRRAGP